MKGKDIILTNQWGLRRIQKAIVSTVPEPNDNFISSYNIKLGTRYQGIIDYLDRDDFLKFVIKEEAKYDIECYMQLDGTLELLNFMGDGVPEFKVAHYDNNDSSKQNILLHPGEYYFKVAPSDKIWIYGSGHAIGLYKVKVTKHAESAESNAYNKSGNIISSIKATVKKCKIKKKKKKPLFSK
ncbi:hypothetical protein [Eubacterium xylanophilum]|uniref:hypothetical protein n=1 Tax=Eubacterium xylanophilum TaxID=39497 RepID=UPI00047A522D|nr:hypothetical protein [Eubacterium xylanophilum]